ncbi:MAG TPA: hypothetical protein VHN80_05960, partial [Kineosporiaceae bacterium]|nr:hypothetical protein [Kineosporiaceae bacterium]
MRNLAVVTLTGMRFPGLAVAALMGLTPGYISTLNGRARDHGSAGLVRELGRPTKLTGRQIAQSGRWRAEKVSAVVIGGTAGCGGTTVAHDPVTINGYGTARQITLFEHGKVALQVLTSDTSTCPVALL